MSEVRSPKCVTQGGHENAISIGADATAADPSKSDSFFASSLPVSETSNVAPTEKEQDCVANDLMPGCVDDSIHTDNLVSAEEPSMQNDADGVQDDGELVLGGIQVTLSGTDIDWVEVHQQLQTDLSGN